MKDSSKLASGRLLIASHAKDTARRVGWGLLITATVLAVLLCAALMDYWLMLPVAVRAVGCALLLLLLGLGLGGWLRLRRHPTSMKEAALDVETQRTDLGCVVSTAAEYLSGERTATRQYEPELVEALEAQAARNLEKVQVPYQNRLLRPAGFFAFVLLVLLVFAATVPVAFTALKRTVVPWSKETYTRVEVQPGSIEIPVGRDLEVTNTFSGRVPKNPALHWRKTNEAAWQMVALTPSTNGSYLHPFKNLQDALQYQVTGNDAVSEVYEISTYVPPEVRALHIGVAYPGYTGVKPFERETPNLTVLRASDLTFRITASTALAKAQLRFSAGAALELTPGSDNQWTGRLKAATNTDYWIELADAKGHRGGNEKPYHLKVLPDNPPTVAIIEPGKDLRADATNTIPLKMAAKDDFGVSEIKVLYHKLGGPEQALICSLTNGEGAEVLGTADLNLTGLELKENEVVAYHAEALDNNTLDGPGRGASPVYFIEVTHEGGAGQCKSRGNGQKVNLLVIQKQIIADTTALAAQAAAEKFSELSTRQKEAADFAQIYHEKLNEAGAPAEATALMDDALKQMKSASQSLADRKRDPALPPEEKALADLYQLLSLMPQLGQMPTQPPPEQEQAQQNQMVKVVLEAIKKQKKEQPSDEELAAALEAVKELSRSQSAMNEAIERPGHSDSQQSQQSQDAQASSSGSQSSSGKQGQPAKSTPKPGQKKEGQQAKAGTKGEEGKENQSAKSGAQSGDGKENQEGGQEGQQAEAQPDGNGAGEKQPAQAGEKPGQGEEGKEGKEGKQGKQGQQGKEGQPGSQGKGGKEGKAGSAPGQDKAGQELEQMAEQETELSQEAAAMAEKLERLAGKDTRLGHNAGQRMSQAAGQMAGAAQALHQGNAKVAGTTGAQSVMNMDKVVALLERILKDQPKLSDVAAEDFPKEYETLISEYLRKLSHEK
jgi:hypothetical protein